MLVAAVAVAVASSGGGGTPAAGHGRTGSGHAASGAGGQGDGRRRFVGGRERNRVGRGGRPGQRTSRRRRCPILMYHVIAPPPAGAPFPGLYVPPKSSPNRCTR